MNDLSGRLPSRPSARPRGGGDAGVGDGDPSGPSDEGSAGRDGDWAARLLVSCRFPAPEAGPVALAVSGGPDSLALMVLAARAGLTGVVLHVDHGLRPGSAAEAALVAEAAATFGFAFRAERVRVAPGPDLEARARRARYSVLPAGVLTGHTMDDQAETVLLNLLRGAGVDGLAAMRNAPAPTPLVARGAAHQADRDGVIPTVRRPLLGIRKHHTMEVCRRAGLAPFEDPTNADGRYRRNRVRADLIPLMNAIAERDVVPLLARQASVMGATADLLDVLAAGIDPTDVEGLRSAPAVLAQRSLRAWLRSGAGHHPPSAAEVARVMDVVHGRFVACELSGGRRVARRRGRLSLSTPQPPSPGGSGEPSVTPGDRQEEGTG
ncbi:MAG: tRNA lysidine(34) synthetase TilS [Acidobacteriota bacterium]|nr:tRNA lysidine(34) synthetase TilS [Acidobacteriota bacterium]